MNSRLYNTLINGLINYYNIKNDRYKKNGDKWSIQAFYVYHFINLDKDEK